MTPNQNININSPAASNNQPMNNSTKSPTNSEKSDSETPEKSSNMSKNDFELIKRNSHILNNNHSDSGTDGTPFSTPRATPVNLVDSLDSNFNIDIDEEAGTPDCATVIPDKVIDEIPDIDNFNLEEQVGGLTSGMKEKDMKEDLLKCLQSTEYKFDTDNQSQMQMNIKENDSAKLHIALGHLINTQEGLQDAIKLDILEDVPEVASKLSEMHEMLAIALDKLKRKQIIIDMLEKSIEIDGIEVWSTVQRFVKHCAQKQWQINGKALGQFARKLSNGDHRKKESDEENQAGVEESRPTHSTSPALDCTTYNQDKDNRDNENFDKGCTPQ